MRGQRWVALCLVAVLGCGSTSQREVTGTVRFQGKALRGGTVTFIDAEGKKAYSAIGPDGRYSVRGVAAGTARIAVQSHGRVPAGLLAPGRPEVKDSTVVEIPHRYSDPENSGLEVRVGKAKVAHDIDLEP
jgi:hypothetical protein